MLKHRKITSKELKCIWNEIKPRHRSLPHNSLHGSIHISEPLFRLCSWYYSCMCRKVKQNWSLHYCQSELPFSCVQYDQDFICNIHDKEYNPSLQKSWWFSQDFLPYINHAKFMHWFQFEIEFHLWHVIWICGLSLLVLPKPKYLQSHLCLHWCTWAMARIYTVLRKTSSILSCIVFCC